jgi:hypothetical protein
MIRIFFLLFLIGYSTSAFGADLSNDDLINACNQKTIVYNKKAERIGEDFNAFCAGYLQATLYALINTAMTKCTSSLINNQTPESLLSIYLTFRKDTAAASSATASTTVLAAYQRAFDCDLRGR